MTGDGFVLSYFFTAHGRMPQRKSPKAGISTMEVLSITVTRTSMEG